MERIWVFIDYIGKCMKKPFGSDYNIEFRFVFIIRCVGTIYEVLFMWIEFVKWNMLIFYWCKARFFCKYMYCHKNVETYSRKVF